MVVKETGSRNLISKTIFNTLLEQRCFFLRKILEDKSLSIRRFKDFEKKMIGEPFGGKDYFIIKPEEVNLSKALVLAKNLLNIDVNFEKFAELEDQRPKEYIFIVNMTSPTEASVSSGLTLIERILLELYCVKIRKERFMPGSFILCTANKTKDGKSPYLLYNEVESRYFLSMADENNVFIDKEQNFYTKVIEV